jgi:hypothetical protein
MCWPWTTPTAGSVGTGVADSAAGLPPTDILLAALRGIPSRVEIAMPGGSVYCNHGDAPRPADVIITRSAPLPRGATLTVWEKTPRIALDDLPVLAWIATPAPGGSWVFRVNSAWAAFTGVPSDLWQTAVHPEDGEFRHRRCICMRPVLTHAVHSSRASHWRLGARHCNRHCV